MFFFKIDQYQGCAAQLWKTLKRTVGEVDHLGSELGCDVLLKVKYLLFRFLQDLWRQSHHKVLFPRTFPGTLQAPGLRELPLGFACWNFNLNSLLLLSFTARASLCVTVTQSGRLIAWTSQSRHSFPRKRVYLLTKEKWIPSVKHVSRKPLNDFYKTQTIGEYLRSKQQKSR